ncbi:MAG: HupE/UreJ family protein, partial [Pseudomonadota bacterium]|nr:HupE/UreJ family protein [Pseudomonadota bacterium]
LITDDHRDLEVSGANDDHKLQDASFFEYTRLGIMHILTGPDHLAFVLGFVLISRRLRDLLFVITGFTVGHSVTLALAVTGIVRPHTAFIDILIALTIALIGAENIAIAIRRPVPVAVGAGALLTAMALARVAGYGSLPLPLLLGVDLFTVCYLISTSRLHDAARVRLVVTLIFGLIHGFAFANDLIEMRLPTDRLVELLFGFNLGVEAGQLLVVGLLVGAAFVLARVRLALPRPITVDVVASGLVCLGVTWMVSRNFG